MKPTPPHFSILDRPASSLCHPILRRVAGGLCGVIVLISGQAAWAADISWSSTAGSTTWSEGTNWLGGTAPADSLTTDIALFNQTSYVNQPHMSVSTSVGGLRIGDGVTSTAELTLGTTAGRVLRIGAGGIFMLANSGDATISTAGGIRLGAPSQSWTNDSSSTLETGTAGTGAGLSSNGGAVTLTLDGSGSGNTVINNLISSAGGQVALIVNKTGSGNVTITGSNTFFTGSTTVRSGTLLVTTNGNALGSGIVTLGDTGGSANATLLNGGNLTIANNIVVQAGNSGTTTIGGSNAASTTATFSGTATLNRDVSLTAVTAGATTDFSGLIDDAAGSFGVTKVGAGIVNLSRAAGNSYDGGTAVNAGTLLINNTSGSGAGTGAIVVNAGTLGGNALVSGAVTVGDGAGGSDAFIAAGNSVGAFATTSTLSFLSDATFVFELDSAAATADQLIASGVTIDGSSVFSFTDLGAGTIALNTEFVIIDNTSGSAISGAFGNLADNSTFTVGANQYQVSYSGGTGNDLTLTVVPEPSTTLLAGLGLLVVLRMARRARGAKA